MVNAEHLMQEMKKQALEFIEQDKIQEAKFFIEQFINLAPYSPDRYILEAKIKTVEKDFQAAVDILTQGIANSPNTFELLYELGYAYERNNEILEAYNMYMQARYKIITLEEKEKSVQSFDRIVKVIRGRNKFDNDVLSYLVQFGDLQLTVETQMSNIIQRKDILKAIEENIDVDANSVLELGFEDEILSKNLNYFGFDVTAFTNNNQNVLNVIAKEWHDNILNSRQKVAKYYHRNINKELIEGLNNYDVIILTEANLENDDILKLLFDKANKQLFIKTNKNSTIDLSNLNGKKIWSSEPSSAEKVELILVSKEENYKPFSIPKGLEIKDSKSTIIEVEISKCTDLFAASYVGDFHHFVEVLKEYEENPDLKYEESSLKAYYEKFTPRNAEEAYFSSKYNVPRLRKGWIGAPWLFDKSKKALFTSNRGETRPGGNHNFGPNTDEFGKNEFIRLIRLYDKIKVQHYHPELFADGYVSGYLLDRRFDYRFVINEGQHRVACLAALGYQNVRCRLAQNLGFLGVVSIENSKNWSQVLNGTYSRNLAEKLFHRFFDDGVGRDRMEY